MVRHLEDILSDIGWSDGFRIPVANDENKALEEEVERKLQQKNKLCAELDDLTQRIDALLKYKKSVENEHQHNQNLIAAHQSQLETEEHLYRLAKSEEDKLQQLLREINKQFVELGDRHNALQNDIFRFAGKLEQLKSSVKMDKDALTAWEEEMARGEEDNSMLTRYTAEDEGKAKDLELKRQNLRMEVESKKKMVGEMVIQVDSLEKVLERTGELFRKVHRERQELIDQWETSVRMLHQRDQDINRCFEEINILKIRKRKKIEALNEQKKFYENEVLNNKELDRQISLETRRLQMMRENSNRLIQLVDELTNEFGITRRKLAATGSQVEHERAKHAQSMADYEGKLKRIEELKTINENLRARYKEVTNRSTSAAEQTRQLEEMLMDEEKALDSMDREAGRVQDFLFRIQRQIDEVVKSKALQDSEIKCVESSKVHLVSQVQTLEKELFRHRELIYGLDYEAQRLQSRIDRMKGKSEREESSVDEEKVAELQAALTEKTETMNLLTNEVQRVDNTVRKLVHEVNKDADELERLQQCRKDETRLIEGGQRQLLTFKSHAQERQVELNMLQFRVRQAEKAVQKEGGHVFTLEKQKLELELAMRERQEEVNMRQEIMKAKVRMLNEEKSKLLAQLQECRLKIIQLQKKHDIAILSMGTSDDGEALSISYIKLKTAQEKYQLQEQGDELDAKIHKAEKEILAMENTLKIVNASNDVYKKNLSVVDSDSPELQEKEALENQYFSSLESLKTKQIELDAINKDIELMEETMEKLLQTEDELRSAWREKDQEAAELDRDIREQQAKLARAETHMRKQLRDIQGRTHQSIEEKDIAARELQDQNLSALQQLAELVAQHMETGPVVSRYLIEKDLELPSTGRSSYSYSRAPSSVNISSEHGAEPSSTRSSSYSYPSPTSASVVNITVEQLTNKGKHTKKLCGLAASHVKTKKK